MRVREGAPGRFPDHCQSRSAAFYSVGCIEAHSGRRAQPDRMGFHLRGLPTQPYGTERESVRKKLTLTLLVSVLVANGVMHTATAQNSPSPVDVPGRTAPPIPGSTQLPLGGSRSLSSAGCGGNLETVIGGVVESVTGTVIDTPSALMQEWVPYTQTSVGPDGRPCARTAWRQVTDPIVGGGLFRLPDQETNNILAQYPPCPPDPNQPVQDPIL